MMKQARQKLLMALGTILFVTGSATAAPASNATAFPFQLNRHFTIAALVDDSFLTRNNDGVFGGYLSDMIRDLSQLANFTYELRIASGYGKDCCPRLVRNATPANVDYENPQKPYDSTYGLQANCAVNDVVDLQLADLYLGLFYLTPERQETNYFTIPFQPPGRGTLSLMGTATHIHSFDDLIQQQERNQQAPVCVYDSTATQQFLQITYPRLRIRPFSAPVSAIYDYIDNGTCTMLAVPTPNAQTFVQSLSRMNQCHADGGKPVGVIATMEFGLSHYAIGVGKHVVHIGSDDDDDDTMGAAHALSYWINQRMIDGTLAQLYQGVGTGMECGYQAFPESKERLLPIQATIGLVLGSLAVTSTLLYFWYRNKLRQQERRYKKRFVQQIARNIAIGPRPGSIPPKKLTEQILHIGNGKEVISKGDLLSWLSDIKMDFISERDFDALWHAIDLRNTGYVNAIEFIVFLSACGPEFERVYNEQETMPKTERLKLAARRLSNLAALGEAGVRSMEQKLERSATMRHGGAETSESATSVQNYFSDHSGRSGVDRHVDV